MTPLQRVHRCCTKLFISFYSKLKKRNFPKNSKLVLLLNSALRMDSRCRRFIIIACTYTDSVMLYELVPPHVPPICHRSPAAVILSRRVPATLPKMVTIDTGFCEQNKKPIGASRDVVRSRVFRAHDDHLGSEMHWRSLCACR